MHSTVKMKDDGDERHLNSEPVSLRLAFNA